METIIWNDSFSVGVAELDEQHRRIIRMMNDLIDSKESLQDRVELAARTIEEMSEYAARHFKAEEKLMQEHGYPGFDGHRAQHTGFRQEIMELGNRVVSYGRTIPADAMEKMLLFLYNWWIHHILQSDMAYKRFFNEKGVF
ncbi:MAG: bacteriohemerythrin [Candidatus Omnitrophica bacterium]|nr:bacteriohemerythrin [Candidatus Omnitrophota bacterium]